MAIRHSITLSTSEPNNEVGNLKIRQGDEQTQTLVANITENGVPKPFVGLQPFFCAKLGQTAGLGIIEQKVTGPMNPANGTLEYVMQPEDWQQLGRQTAYFSFRKMVNDHEWTEQFSTRDFNYNVTKSVFSEGVKETKKDGSTYIWTIEDMIRYLQEFMDSGRTDFDEWYEEIKDNLSEDAAGNLMLLYQALRDKTGKDTDFRGFESDESFMKRVYNENIERGLNPKWFGAKGDGINDDTNAFQAIFDFAKTSKSRKLSIIGEGTYLLTTKGVDSENRQYAVRVDDMYDKLIDFGNSKFIVDRNSTAPSYFAFYNCKNLNFVSVDCVSDDKPLFAAIALYCNAGIYFKNCERCRVEKSKFFNTKYGVCAMQSQEIIVDGNNYDNNLTKYDYPFRGASAILFYGTSKSIARNNVIFGALHDGNLSVFGGGSNDCLIENNSLYGYSSNGFEENTLYSQGITIDQGPRNTIVRNNMIERYFYGIDSKAGTFDTKIIDNDIKNCKVGIIDRPGEKPSVANHTLNTQIKDNTVVFGVFSKKNSYKHLDLYDAVGIVLDKRYAGDIKNNVVKVTTSNNISDQTVCGIAVSQSSSPLEYMDTIALMSNRVILQTGHDAIVSRAGDYSTCIHADSIISLKMSDNLLKIGFESNDAYKHSILSISGSNQIVEFSKNTIHGVNDKTEIIKLVDESAVMTKFTSFANKSVRKNIRNFEYVDNTRVTKTFYDFNENGSKVEFCVNGVRGDFGEWIEITKIYTQYTNNLLTLNIKGNNNETTAKFIDISLLVKFKTSTTVETQVIQESLLGYEVQVISISTNVFSLQVKPNSNVSKAKFILTLYGLGANVWL